MKRKDKQKKIIINIIGWYGTISIISAYALLNFSVFNSSNLIYQLLNLTGAIGIITISVYEKAYQPAVLNILWAAIAVFIIIKTFLF